MGAGPSSAPAAELGPPPQWTEAQLKKLFEEVDVDCSGALEASEVHQLAVKLGVELSPTELKDAMYRMGQGSASNQIDFDNFANWWRSNSRDKLQLALVEQIGAHGSMQGSGALFG